MFLVACGAPPTEVDNSEIISKAEAECLKTFPGEVMDSIVLDKVSLTFVDTGELSYGECQWDSKTGEITETISSENIDEEL